MTLLKESTVLKERSQISSTSGSCPPTSSTLLTSRRNNNNRLVKNWLRKLKNNWRTLVMTTVHSQRTRILTKSRETIYILKVYLRTRK
jgi:hypothetical protein